MAAAAPSHRMPSIHGAFGAPSRFGPAAGLSPAQASWNRIPNVCAPRRTYELAPAARTTPASVSVSVRSRPRRTTISAGSWGSPVPSPTRRAPPPPPPPAERTASALQASIDAAPVLPTTVPIPEIDDPFADAHEELTPFPPVRSRVSHGMSGSRIISTSRIMNLAIPPGLGATVPSAKDTRGRLVATTLLNRGSGRPLGVYLRRRLSGEGSTYVKSGLSQLVAAAA